jgi:hypothetical protein
MNVRSLVVGLVAALLLLPTIPYALAAGSISVSTGSQHYKPGELVTISGVTSQGSGKLVYISVNNTQAIVFPLMAVTSGTDGKFQASFTLTSSAYIGVYNVGANDLVNKAKSHFVVSKITPSDLADNLIKLADDAKLRADKRLQELEAQGVTIPTEAQKAYDNGVTNLNQARTLLAGGKALEALEAARDAMVNFSHAIRDSIKAAKQDNENNHEDNVLNSAIHRGLNLVDKLNATIARLKNDEQTGPEIGVATHSLKSAKAKLLEAQTAMNANPTETSAVQGLIDAAKADLDVVLKKVQIIASTRMHDGILKWLHDAEERINNLEAQLKDMNGNHHDEAQAALGKLEEAKGNIRKAMAGHILGRDLEALGFIGKAEDGVKSGLGHMSSGGSSSKLTNTNVIQAKIQFLQRTEAQMQKWGMDITSIKAQIDALQKQLDAQTITP